MIPAVMVPRPSPGVDERFLRVVRQRLRAARLRVAEAALIGVLAGFATRNPALAIWFGAVMATGLLEAVAGRRALDRPTDAWAARAAGVCQLVSATSYSAVVLLLLAQANIIGLAAAAFVMCAVALGNALQSSGSRLATATLVTPPAIFLIGAPLWVGLVRGGFPPTDTVLLALGGFAYVGFILRLSASAHAERSVLRQARRDAEAGAQRWRMIFDYSPIARLCFDASPLYALLQTHARGRTRLGDVMRTELASVSGMLQHVRLLEGNAAAKALLGRRIATAHLAPSFIDAFCTALNDIDENGVVPPFAGEIIIEGGETMFVQAHYRMSPGPDTPWSFCVGTYADMTESHRIAQAQQEARQAAEDASQAKSDFLTTMSHEIRTPLNGVLGMAQAMAADPLTTAQRERLRVIHDSGLALTTLLDDLLHIALDDDPDAPMGSPPRGRAPSRPPSDTPPPPPAPRDSPMRVLAAEDNPVNRMVLKALLAQFEIEPTLVENGAEAVRAWESAHWDLILMDVQMPVMDGPTATMTIRAREGMTGRPRTPIVAVTANTLPHQVASYRAAGMDEVVGKPLNLNELFAAMITAVNAEPETTTPMRAAS